MKRRGRLAAALARDGDGSLAVQPAAAAAAPVTVNVLDHPYG